MWRWSSPLTAKANDSYKNIDIFVGVFYFIRGEDMLFSLGIIVIFGLVFDNIFKKIKLPGLLGLLILGILIGPFGLDLLSNDILDISEDLRRIALIIILLRAGLGIKRVDIEKNSVAVLKMGFIPGLIEGLTIALVSIKLLNFTFIQGGILGFIIAAVSPAVVVPSMLDIIETGLGEEKGVPTLITASASIDDVFAITIFGIFLDLYITGGNSLFLKFLNIPISIILGIALGALISIILIKTFQKYTLRLRKISNSKKILLVLGASMLFSAIEDILSGTIAIASLLGIMAIGFLISEKLPKIGKELSEGFNKIWVFARFLLFVLVGAEVNIYTAIEGGKIGIIIIAIGLISRSIGVILSLKGSKLNAKEKLFCIIAYSPKATVQAAIGSIPLAMGVEGGELILAIAVLSILITAPLGAIGIKLSSVRLL